MHANADDVCQACGDGNAGKADDDEHANGILSFLENHAHARDARRREHVSVRVLLLHACECGHALRAKETLCRLPLEIVKTRTGR